MVEKRSRERQHAYLLRVWEERSTQPPYRVLRLSLEAPHVHERRGFDSPEALARYLTDYFTPTAQDADEEPDNETASG
jgi:hypothetical protein